MNFKKAFKLLISSCLGALILIFIFNNAKININGVELAISLKPAFRGFTAIILPPLGNVKAYTHVLPVRLNIELKNIDIDLLKTLIYKSPDKSELWALFKDEIMKSLYLLGLKTAFLGTAGAFLTAYILKYTKKEILACCIIGIIIPILLLGSLFLSYDLDAFSTPEYTGTLKAAPWIISTVNKGIAQINELGKQLKNISDSASSVFSKMDSIGSIDQSSVIKILHVSDIHNNPAALNFMDQIVKNFNVNYIIDTGDITDYGTPLENLVIKEISKLPVKYFFVTGNHDSNSTVDLFEEVENAVVLNGQEVDLGGIRLLGFSDPISKSDDIKSPDILQTVKLNMHIQEQLSHGNIPDILAVHNPEVTNNLVGKVPVILNGHTHRFSIKQDRGSVVINSGTTGAAGIRGLQSKNDLPYSAVLLYFQRNEDEKYRLAAVDVIKISNLKAGFQVERMIFDRVNQGE